MGYVMSHGILPYLFTFLLTPVPVQSSTDCCVSFTQRSLFDELLVTTEFSTHLVGGTLQLRANVTWTPSPDYKGYDMDFVLASTEKDVMMCFLKDQPCCAENELLGSWRVYDDLQFGSTYIITMYVSEVADNVRGKYLSGFSISPDCYDKTKNTEFCMNQTVGYIGKPFNITTVIKRANQNSVIAYVTWRQPIHANRDTPLVYYIISYYDADDHNTIKLSNITYVPGEYLTTELGNPLQEGQIYTLIITPVVNDGGNYRLKSESRIQFNTNFPDEPESTTTNGDIVGNIYSGVEGVVCTHLNLLFCLIQGSFIFKWLG